MFLCANAIRLCGRPRPGEAASIVREATSTPVTSARSTLTLHSFAASWRIGAGDLGGRQDRRRHLREQRLKYVVVAAVDQHDLSIGVAQCVRRCHPGKAAADDNGALGLSAGVSTMAVASHVAAERE